jgi:subfamily B ATP-binding cassette protein MsbA
MLIFPLYVLVFAAMNPRVRGASERMQRKFSHIAGDVAERFAGQALIKTYTAEERESRRFSEDIACHHGLVIDQSHVGHTVAAFGEVLVHAGTTVVIGYGGWLALGGEMTAGTLTRFLGYMLILFGPVRRFAELNITYQTSLSAMRRVFRVFDLVPSVVEAKDALRTPPEHGRVTFEHVRFRYDDDDARGSSDSRWVLDGISLDVRPGERIAIVGASGAGKTTLVSLIPRLYDVTSGRLLVDGIDVRAYGLAALRSAIGVVQQDSFLFAGTIRDNVAYGRPDAADEEVIEAAVLAHAHEFIRELPDGYDARIGERGVNLSGGQRQRLSIARALLKRPRILVLDEATSSLDADSEAVVQRALERAMQARTCFIVAHRLSTIRNADRIFVLDAGRVAESGTHRELLSARGVYARLLQNQAAVL